MSRLFTLINLFCSPSVRLHCTSCEIQRDFKTAYIVTFLSNFRRLTSINGAQPSFRTDSRLMSRSRIMRFTYFQKCYNKHYSASICILLHVLMGCDCMYALVEKNEVKYLKRCTII